MVLSGRLAYQAELDSSQAARELTAFVAANYGRYQGRPIAKVELEPMLIVSRWLRERRADEGQLVFLNGPFLPLQALLGCEPALNADTIGGPAAPGRVLPDSPSPDLVTQPRSSE